LLQVKFHIASELPLGLILILKKSAYIMLSITKDVVIIRTNLQKQKGDIDSKLYRGIHIVCSLLSRQVEPEILIIH
jgi:hypothetical protein